jgi:rhodanese-related sulfurtransferase
MGRSSVIVMLLAVTGLAGPVSGQEAPVALIKVAEVAHLLSGGGQRVMLVDVRTRDEYLDRHIRGAVSVPLAEIDARHAEVPRQGLVVLY